MVGFIEISIAYVMLVTPFAIDAVVGMGIYRKVFSHASEGGYINTVYSKEFVFSTSQVETI